MQRNRVGRKRGWIMTETLLALWIAALLLPIEIAALKLLVGHAFFDPAMQDEISLAQLRRVLNVCYGKNTDGFTLACDYQDEEIEFRVQNGLLYATPGTWIFLSEVDEAYWRIENGLVILNYFRGSKETEAVLSFE